MSLLQSTFHLQSMIRTVQESDTAPEIEDILEEYDKIAESLKFETTLYRVVRFVCCLLTCAKKLAFANGFDSTLCHITALMLNEHKNTLPIVVQFSQPFSKEMTVIREKIVQTLSQKEREKLYTRCCDFAMKLEDFVAKTNYSRRETFPEYARFHSRWEDV